MAKPPTAAVSSSAAPEMGADEINLRDPTMAAILAWLIPGLGHWYQGRRSKAVLLFVCIMGTFVYGLYLGEGRVVYASFRSPEDKRLPYLCQVCVGLPSMPALVQAYRFGRSGVRREAEDRLAQGKGGVWDWFMAPPSLEQIRDPQRRPSDDDPDELDLIHKRLHRFFELGTVYTMVAGLLNVLAIFDAWGGPAYGQRVETSKKKDEDPAAEDPKPAEKTDAA